MADEEFDATSIRDFIRTLTEIAERTTEPPNFRRIAAAAADRLQEALDERIAGRRDRAEDIILGTKLDDGSRANDGLEALLPRWAKDTVILDRLAGVVVPDPSAEPPTVTIHWERVPRDLRREATSLANELVDAFYGRPVGGRPRRRGSEDETG